MSDMVDKLRNIALAAHAGAGKTSLAEVMLYNNGLTNRLGKVDEGNTIMDFEPEELVRRSSISTVLSSVHVEETHHQHHRHPG